MRSFLGMLLSVSNKMERGWGVVFVRGALRDTPSLAFRARFQNKGVKWKVEDKYLNINNLVNTVWKDSYLPEWSFVYFLRLSRDGLPRVSNYICVSWVGLRLTGLWGKSVTDRAKADSSTSRLGAPLGRFSRVFEICADSEGGDPGFDD